MYELSIETNFSSAHNLRGYEGACENLHGHNWRVEVFVSSPALDSLGMVVDFKKIKNETKTIVDRLDHKYLNELAPFTETNATAENIARHIYTELSKTLNNGPVKVSRVRVWESDCAAASYYEG